MTSAFRKRTDLNTEASAKTMRPFLKTRLLRNKIRFSAGISSVSVFTLGSSCRAGTDITTEGATAGVPSSDSRDRTLSLETLPPVESLYDNHPKQSISYAVPRQTHESQHQEPVRHKAFTAKLSLLSANRRSEQQALSLRRLRIEHAKAQVKSVNYIQNCLYRTGSWVAALRACGVKG